MTEYERFGLVFTKRGSLNSGTGIWEREGGASEETRTPGPQKIIQYFLSRTLPGNFPLPITGLFSSSV
jgi:hypothetical protein